MQNVWKCIVFLAFAFKIAKSAIMTQTIFFLKNINTGIKNTQNFMLISNSLMPAFWNAPNKLKAKNHEKMHKNEKTQNSHSFLALAFFRGICFSIKFCVFLIPILIFFKKEMFCIIIALFAILKANAKKNVHFQTLCKK